MKVTGIVTLAVTVAVQCVPCQALPNPAFAALESGFRAHAAAIFGTPAADNWDSASLLIQRPWIVKTIAAGVSRSAPVVTFSLQGVAVQMQPVDLTLDQTIVPVQVCDGSNCGFLKIVCAVGCFVADGVATVGATALNLYVKAFNGRNVGTFTASNLSISGSLASSGVAVTVNAGTDTISVAAPVTGALNIAGQLRIDIHGAAQLGLLCSGVRTELADKVNAASVTAQATGPVEFQLVTPDSVSISVQLTPTLDVIGLDLPSLFSLFWRNPLNYFACPNPLVNILLPMVDLATGGYHPDEHWQDPQVEQLLVATVHAANVLTLNAALHPIVSPQAVGLALVRNP